MFSNHFNETDYKKERETDYKVREMCVCERKNVRVSVCVKEKERDRGAL